MKKNVYLLALFFVASIIFTSCGARRRAIQDPAVVIDGVRWATRNVDTSGSFTKNPEDAGGLFDWYEAQNACPRGWRLPTREELQSLKNATGGEWTAVNEVRGRTFGTMPNQLFLPAAGWRSGYDGLLRNVGVVGHYWSSTQSSSEYAVRLLFYSGDVVVGSPWRQDGQSVRCVAK